MKTLSTALLDGMTAFVMLVLICCVGMAIASYLVKIDADTYKFIGWTIPACFGFGKFCGSLIQQTKWYQNAQEKDDEKNE
jgi:di/tricarboxylate transporter